jgi:hypothetical protein
MNEFLTLFRETPCRRLDSLGPFATTQAQLKIRFISNSGRYYVDFEDNEKFSVSLCFTLML